jgi:apolipoprotein N-acyltransferase
MGNGHWHLPIAAWLSPVFMLLFIQSNRAVIGLGFGFLVQLCAFFVNWWDIIPVPGAWYYVAAGAYAAAYFLPFVIHRWLATSHPGFRSTLILPVSWVTVELLLTWFTPYGSWASIGYTQVDHLALLQIVSLTGLPGISFLVLWFASTCNWVWRNRSRGTQPYRYSLIYVVVLLAVVMAGEARLYFTGDVTRTLRVASLIPSSALTQELQEAMAEAGGRTSDGSPKERVLVIAERLNSDLLRRSRTEALAGAELIVWSEHASKVTGPGEAELIDLARDIAREFSVPIVLGIGVWLPDETPSFENKAVIINGDGELAATYHKAKPIVGQESSLIQRGEQTVAMLNTDLVRFAAVICHDLDFPDFVRQAGRNRANILLGPSSDWEAITPLHPRMAVVRAVENGCALVRPCSNGLSLAVDATGRILSSRIDDDPGGCLMISHVPTGRRSTLYPWIGDLFAHLNLAALVLLIAWTSVGTLIGRRSSTKGHQP